MCLYSQNFQNRHILTFQRNLTDIIIYDNCSEIYLIEHEGDLTGVYFKYVKYTLKYAAFHKMHYVNVCPYLECSRQNFCILMQAQ